MRFCLRRSVPSQHILILTHDTVCSINHSTPQVQKPKENSDSQGSLNWTAQPYGAIEDFLVSRTTGERRSTEITPHSPIGRGKENTFTSKSSNPVEERRGTITVNFHLKYISIQTSYTLTVLCVVDHLPLFTLPDYTSSFLTFLSHL